MNLGRGLLWRPGRTVQLEREVGETLLRVKSI
jgi:hypothetical protein